MPGLEKVTGACATLAVQQGAGVPQEEDAAALEIALAARDLEVTIARDTRKAGWHT